MRRTQNSNRLGILTPPPLAHPESALHAQEHAKKFLHNGGEDDRYQFFLQAANMATRKVPKGAAALPPYRPTSSPSPITFRPPGQLRR